ncbi:hypothetical protein ASF19_20585 [Acidovorax sp. Leaf84]|nr:hypothetical protein ASF19_20585 [Acidovorax sp. Leaf84]
MPKLACPCGYVHNLSPIPDDGWVVLRDRDADARSQADVESRLYECPDCNRLMWQRPGDDLFTIYRRES